MKTKKNNQFMSRDHVQISGTAMYDENRYFFFTPSECVPDSVRRFRRIGMAQQMPDGTFDFVARTRLRSQSQLIRKLAHGRISKTKDGAIQLTLKVYDNEDLNIGSALKTECEEAADALIGYQLKR